MGTQGMISLVGAGPGDPGLLTARGLACLRQAQVVAHDRLVHPRWLDEAPSTGEGVDEQCDAPRASDDCSMSRTCYVPVGPEPLVAAEMLGAAKERKRSAPLDRFPKGLVT